MGMARLGHRKSHPHPCAARRAQRVAEDEMSVRIPGRILSAEALGLVLVVTALQTLTYGITFSLQNTDTKYFFWVCLVAALLSRGLNKTGWNGVQASAAIAALGVLGLWVLGARLASPLLHLLPPLLPL